MNNPLEIGSYISGVDSAGALTNYNLLGMERIATLNDFFSGGGYAPKARLSSTPVLLRVVRNGTGGPLAASDLVQMDLSASASRNSSNVITTSGTGSIPLLEVAKKKTDNTGLAFSAVVDPMLKTTVPANGIFYVVIEGPTLARMIAAGEDIAVGTFLVSAASGRVTSRGSEASHLITGYALETRTQADHAGGLILMQKIRPAL